MRKAPEIAKFHKFLVSETESGNVSRQEAVSMIPPLLLDVLSSHLVLDMCAAPGSKTAQIIEAIHADCDPIPAGMVIANDSDYDRSYTLVRQCKRLCSPAFMVTNHEAQFFPLIYTIDKEKEMEVPLLFDRILADVPCSGDGTLRKNKLIWKNWNGHNANSLHKLQVQILLRGIQLLKVGGRIVYSTCSFSPVENEAVVAEALRECAASIQLIDVSASLPQLKRNAGLTTWTVSSKDGTLYTSYDTVPENKRKSIPESAFPPSNVGKLGLEKCLRILPYDQDTGGFFVAVFEKVGSYGTFDCKPAREIKASSEVVIDEASEPALKKVKIDDSIASEPAIVTENPQKPSLKQTHHHKKSWPGKEADFIFLTEESPDIKNLVEFYGIPGDFPKDQFVVRSEVAKKRNIYFTNEMIKRVVQAKNAYKLQIVNTGIKIFSRNEGSKNSDKSLLCPMRICADGVNLLKWTTRKIVAKLPDVLIMLRESYPHISKFSIPAQEKLVELGEGSCLMEFDPSDCEDVGFKVVIYLPVWKSKSGASLLLDKQECRALLMRLTGEEYLIKSGAAGGGSVPGRIGLDRDMKKDEGEVEGSLEVEDEER